VASAAWRHARPAGVPGADGNSEVRGCQSEARRLAAMPANGTASSPPRRSPAPAAARRTARRAARRWRARRREPVGGVDRHEEARQGLAGACRGGDQHVEALADHGQAASCGAVGPPGTAARTTTRPPDGTRPGRGVPRPACREGREQVGWPMVVTSVTLYFTTQLPHSCREVPKGAADQGFCTRDPGRVPQLGRRLSDADDRGARDRQCRVREEPGAAEVEDAAVGATSQ